MKQIKNLLLVGLSVAMLTSIASENDLQKGLDAYFAGDYKTAFNILTPLAEAGNDTAQSYLDTMSGDYGIFNFQKGLDAYKAGHYVEAFNIWIPIAEAGDANAQYYLGVMYTEGKGLRVNYEKAEKWFRLAAEGYHREAIPDSDRAARFKYYGENQFKLGLMYEHGWGVKQSDEEAVKWYHLAAEGGNADAQKCLAQNYKNCEQLVSK